MLGKWDGSTRSKVSSPLCGELAYCENVEVGAGTRPSLFGGPPRSVGVAAQFFIKLLGLPVCPRMISGGKILFGAQYSAYRVQDLGHELFLDAGENVLEGTVRLDPVLQKRDSHCSCRGIQKQHSPRHFGKPAGYDEDEGVLLRDIFQRAK